MLNVVALHQLSEREIKVRLLELVESAVEEDCAEDWEEDENRGGDVSNYLVCLSPKVPLLIWLMAVPGQDHLH